MRHPPRPMSSRALWAQRLALSGLAVTLSGVAATRYGLFPALQSLAIFATGLLLCAIACVVAMLAIAGIWNNGALGIGKASGAIFLAIVVLALPATVVLSAYSLPAINDISTDLTDPPAFSRSRAALAARNQLMPAESSSETRDAQRLAYREITPIILEMGEMEAYTLVLEAIAAEKWQVVEQVPPTGRSGTGHIDAVDQSLIMRFKDDITLRIRPMAGETRVDIRSVSRLGRSDFGANAARIRRFSAALIRLSKG